MGKRNYNRGDTLVEVIVSFAVFTVVAISVSVLMNRGLAIGQQSLELSLVREQISSQAEMLRFARYDTKAASKTLWEDITSRAPSVSDPAKRPVSCGEAPAGNAFILYPGAGIDQGITVRDINSTTYVSPETSSFVSDDGDAQGMWIQVAEAEADAAEPGVTPAKAYDFYIHGCWNLPASDSPQTSVTVVRLYDER